MRTLGSGLSKNLVDSSFRSVCVFSCPRVHQGARSIAFPPTAACRGHLACTPRSCRDSAWPSSWSVISAATELRQSRAVGALEVDGDSPIYVGETNIENAFHRFGVPYWLMLTWTAAHQGLGVTPAGDSGLVGPLGCSSCKTSEWSHSVGLRRPSLALLAWSGLTWRTGWSTSSLLLAWEPLQVSAPRTRPAVRLGSVGISWSRHARDKLLQVRCYSVLGICRRLSLNCPQPSCSLEASPRPRAGDV